MKNKKSKKIDESIQIDTELSTLFHRKSMKKIENERKIAKRLNVSYQLYFDTTNSGKVKLI